MERGDKQILWTGSSVAQMGKEIVDALKCSGHKLMGSIWHFKELSLPT